MRYKKNSLPLRNESIVLPSFILPFLTCNVQPKIDTEQKLMNVFSFGVTKFAKIQINCLFSAISVQILHSGRRVGTWWPWLCNGGDVWQLFRV